MVIDCRWASRGFNSEQATVYVLDGTQDKVICVVSALRQRAQQPVLATPHEVQRLLLKRPYSAVVVIVVSQAITVQNVPPSGTNTSTETAIFDYKGTSRGMEGFLVRIALDIGHAAKNIKKKIIDSGKEFPQLRGFGERSQRDFRTLVTTHRNNPDTPNITQSQMQTPSPS